MTQTNQDNAIDPGSTGSAPRVQDNGGERVMPRRKVIRWVLAAMVAVAVIFGTSYYLHSISYESTDDAFIDGHIVTVSPRVAGHVAEVYVSDNQWVRAGEVLIDLDPRDFDVRLDAASAAQDAAESEFQKAKAQLKLSMAELDQAKAEADFAKAKHQRDSKDRERYQELAATRTVSKQNLDHAVAEEQISRAELVAAEKQIETRQSMVLQAKASLKTAQANRHLASAEAEQARLDRSYTRVDSPADGFVTKKGIEPGMFVQAGQSLMSIVPLEMWVTANFKETQLTRMRRGQPVEIKIDAYPNIILHGHIDSIQHGTDARFSFLPPENATGNFVKVVQRVPVKIVFDPDGKTRDVLLSAGMSVVPTVDISDKGYPDDTDEAAPLQHVVTSVKKGADSTP